MKYAYILLFYLSIAFSKVHAQITQKQIKVFLNDTAVHSGHMGISIYEPATKKYLYNYNEEKNFVPSSNIKLFTMYAGMKYLGDSLVGIRYLEDSSNLIVYPSGDPTLLHPDFKNQPVIDFLKATKKEISIQPIDFRSKPYGNGWAWNDYPDYYMAERSPLPVYGNCISFIYKKNSFQTIPKNLSQFSVYTNTQKINETTSVERDFFSNKFTVHLDNKKDETIVSPYITSITLAAKLLEDSIGKNITIETNELLNTTLQNGKEHKIYSRQIDSMLKPMMHNSDNFFAEQTLLMVSNEKLGYMSDEKIIDTLLKTDFKDLPNKPNWVDGCGLSRYNLFTPKDFIFLLDKMKTEFGIERIKGILPTAGQGTLKGYYENAAGFIYAKTGSMSNNVSLSGYLYTKKNKMLIFSIHINSYSGSGRAGRRAIEKMLLQIRENN